MAEKESPWSPEAKKVMEAVGLMGDAPVKTRGHNHVPDCPYCLAADAPNALEGAKKICSTAPGKEDDCMTVLRDLGDITDRETWDFGAEKLKKITGPSDYYNKFLKEARRLWFNEK